MDDKFRYSNKRALEILDKQIKETEADIVKLEEIISQNQKTSNKLLLEYNKKKIYIANLQKKKDEIENSLMDVSYGSVLKDHRLAHIIDKTTELNEELGAITQEHDSQEEQMENVGRNNKFVQFRKVKLEQTIQRLEKKRGEISKKQGVIVDRKLKRQLGRMSRNKDTLREERTENIQSFKSKYDERIEEYKGKMDNYHNEAQNYMSQNKYISGALNYVPYAANTVPLLFSYAKKGLLIGSCYAMTAIKTVFYYGCRDLPYHIVQAIKGEKRNGPSR